MFRHGPDFTAGTEGVCWKVFGPDEMQPFEEPVRVFDRGAAR